MRAATQTAATDPLTGSIDMDMITTGRTASDRNLLHHLIDSLKQRLSFMSANMTLEIKDIQSMLRDESGVDVSLSLCCMIGGNQPKLACPTSVMLDITS